MHIYAVTLRLLRDNKDVFFAMGVRLLISPRMIISACLPTHYSANVQQNGQKPMARGHEPLVLSAEH